nr:succinate dehydrogenase subunit 7A, mitochondrial-like isoform X1 [Ipomoea batatas]
MAFSVGKSALSQLRLYTQKADDSSSVAPRRGLHIEPGAREKAVSNYLPLPRLCIDYDVISKGSDLLLIAFMLTWISAV